MRNMLLTLTLLSFLFLFSPFTKELLATEGVYDMTSVQGDPARCEIYVVRMQNLDYNALANCRDLMYPVDESVNNYVVWATPIKTVQDKKDPGPLRLGILGYGKAYYVAKRPFSNIYVTTESNPNVKAPTGSIVMQAKPQSVPFLDKPTTPTPTPKEESQRISETVKEEAATTAKMSLKDKVVLGLKRAGLAAVFALVAIGGLVFVLTRPRG